MTGTRDKVARFLYKNDGNPNLPEDRQWESLSLYWRFKYLKLAGYEEGEMMEFIDREMGKNKDTEFLYQSSLGRKFLKEKKE